jgi:hypothetical protein
VRGVPEQKIFFVQTRIVKDQSGVQHAHCLIADRANVRHHGDTRTELSRIRRELTQASYLWCHNHLVAR